MGIIVILLWIIVTFFVGYGLLVALAGADDTLSDAEKLCLSFPLGLGVVTLQMAILSLLDIPFSCFSLISWWIPFWLYLFATKPKCISHLLESFTLISKEAPPKKWERLLILGIGLQTSFLLFRTFLKPLEAYDAIAKYAIRAKIFYIEKGIPFDIFQELKDMMLFIPLSFHVPLAETYFYTFVGEIDDMSVKVIFPIFYALILFLFYLTAKRCVQRQNALLFTFLLATVPQFAEQSTNGYADIFVSFYYFASLVYLMRWFKEEKILFLSVSAVFSLLMLWTKPECGVLLFANCLLIIIRLVWMDGRRIMPNAMYCLFVLGLIGGYLYLNSVLGLREPLFEQNAVYQSLGEEIFLRLSRIPNILYEYQMHIFGPKKWNIIWIVWIVLLIVQRKYLFSKEQREWTIIIFLAFSGYTSVYLLANEDYIWLLEKSTSRLWVHLLPSVIFYSSILYQSQFPKK